MSEDTRRLLLKTPYFEVRQDGRWYSIYEEHAKNASAVLALHRGEHVVLVEQYRNSLSGTRREIPRGYSESGETALQCAQREFFEETGFKPSSEKFLHLGNVEPNSGLLESSIALFFCTVVDDDKLQSHDLAEIDRVHLVPLETFRQQIAENSITDGFTLSAFALASLRGLI